jgi:hypothetical protein
MFSSDAYQQIAADRRAQAMASARRGRTAGMLRRRRGHAPPVPLRRAPRPEVGEPEAA